MPRGHRAWGYVCPTSVISSCVLSRSVVSDSLWPHQAPVYGIFQARILATAAAKLLQSCPTLCDPTDGSPPGSPSPWDSPGKNTRVGCHFLLQWMKVKSESEVAQSCPTLSDPMDCSLPGSSVHGIFQARLLEWGLIKPPECTEERSYMT